MDNQTKKWEKNQGKNHLLNVQFQGLNLEC